jgi:hypothetical protein
MNRMKMMGLCLAAMFAFSAIIVSVAQAGEFGNCVKQKKPAVGKYINAECTKEGAAKTTYEWVSAKGEKSTDTTKATVWSSALGKITSKKSKGTDEITGWQTDTAETTFEGWVWEATKGKCENLSEYTGKTPYSGKVTFYNHTELIDHGTIGPSGLEPKEGEVWDEFAPLEGSPVFPYDAYYICEPGVIFRTVDTISGVVEKVNAKPSKAGEDKFAEGLGEQDLQTEYSENGGEAFSSTGPNVEATTAKIKWNSDVEIRACNEPNCPHEE